MQTNYKLTEKELKNMYLLIMNKISDGFIIVDYKGKILSANKAIVKMLEADSAEKIIGKNIYDFLDKEYTKKAIKDLLNLKTKGKELLRRYEVKNTKGKTIWVEGIGRVVRFRGKARVLGIIGDVSVKKEAEEELRYERDLFKKAQKISHMGSWRLDIVKNKLSWSDEIYRIFGLKPQQFGATYEAFLKSVHPKDRKMVDRAYTDSLKNKTPYLIDHRIVLPAGEIRYVQEKCDTDFDKRGKPLVSVGTVLDITERKKCEGKLKNLANTLKVIRDVNHVIIKVKDKNKLLCGVVNILYTTEGFNCIFLNLFNNKLKSGKIYHAGKEKYTVQQLQKIHNSKYINKIIKEKFIYIKDATKAPYKQHLKKISSHSGLAGLIHHKERYYGILTIHMPIGAPEPSDKEMSFFKELVGDIGYALHGIEQEEQRKKAEEKMKESEEKFRLISESSIQSIYRFDLKGFLTYANHASEDLTKYSVEELNSGKINIAKFFTGKARLLLRKSIDTLMAGKSVAGEQVVTQKDGNKILVYFSSAPIIKNGKYVGFMGTVQDITEKKKSEKNLKERIKEINSLYRLSRLAEGVENFEELAARFKKDIISPSMQFPDKIHIGLQIDKKNYTTCHKHKPGDIPYNISAPILVKGKKRGKLIVGYLEDLPFLKKFEQRLVEDYAKRFGLVIEKKEAEEKLKKRIDELERFHDLTIGRELRMMELKEKIKKLENRLKNYK